MILKKILGLFRWTLMGLLIAFFVVIGLAFVGMMWIIDKILEKMGLED